jgi:hypothetical protein
MNQVHAISLQPSDKPVGIEVTLEKKPFMDVIAAALPSFREWQTDNPVPPIDRARTLRRL